MIIELPPLACINLMNNSTLIDVRGPYLTPELNNELQFNWETCGKNLPCVYLH